MKTPDSKSTKRRPTLSNDVRHGIAHLIRSKLPGVEISWSSGHGTFLAQGQAFCFITREGDLAIKLAPELMEQLVGNGEATYLHFGKRVMKEWIVITPGEDPLGALELLKEARSHAERQPRTVRKKAT
jgi:hypothetical protein